MWRKHPHGGAAVLRCAENLRPSESNMNLRSALATTCSALLLFAPMRVNAQQQGAPTLAHDVLGFGTTARVLIIGAHPDDEDTGLIAWLALGRKVETAYLSLTRGDGGQNVIGDELGEALGAVRTEEMLAARRLDGGRQYFTRAYDFGFSKDSTETLTHWPREDILGDLVKVIRAFRPHVIIAMWSGTAADGHGHHTVSGVLARDAFDAGSDTIRFPIDRFGGQWVSSKFYRALRGNAAPGAVRVNIGEYDVVAGRSLADIAAESRAQHKSQGQGRLPLEGIQWSYLRREATRVNEQTAAASEKSIFDAIDTSWTRLIPAASTPALRAVIDSIPVLAAAASAALDLRNPQGVVPILARAMNVLERARSNGQCRYAGMAFQCSSLASDLASTIEVSHRRAREALLAAASVSIDAFADREYLAMGDTAHVNVHVVNRGGVGLRVRVVDASYLLRAPDTTAVLVAQDSVVDIPRQLMGRNARGPAWWIEERSGYDFFPDLMWDADGTLGMLHSARTPSVSGFVVAEDQRQLTAMDVRVELAGAVFTHRVGPVEYRRGDPVRGDLRTPLVPVEAVSLLFDRALELMRADHPIDRIIRLRVRSYSTHARPLTFQYKIPDGLEATGLPDTMTIGALETRDIPIRVRGRVGVIPQPMTALATESRTRQYGAGLFTVKYDHIRPVVLRRASGLWVKGVEVEIPEKTRVVYIRGVSDDVAPILTQIEIPVTVIDPGQFGSFDLEPYQVLILGPRVYALSPGLSAFNDRITEFARNGGTVIVQYGQQEMTRPGMLPYPIELAQPPQRVTLENSPVTIVDSAAQVLRFPNRISASDFEGWTQERALYMPSAADTAWKKVLEMHDAGEPRNANALLLSRVGSGMFVYTTIAFHRQLPQGHDGAIRLFVNLLAAGMRPVTR